jgi:hypothetical protein
MEELVLRNLIELYKAKGISFEHLLKNEVFLALPVEARIKLIKAHAKELSDGVHFDSTDVKYLLKTIGSIAAVGLGAYHAVRPLSSPILKTIATSAAAGATYTAYDNFNNLRKDIKKKDMTRSLLTKPTDQNSVSLMAQLAGLKIIRK